MVLLSQCSEEIAEATRGLGLVSNKADFLVVARNICELGRIANLAMAKEPNPDPAVLEDVAEQLRLGAEAIEASKFMGELPEPERRLMTKFISNIRARSNEMKQESKTI